MPGRRLVLVVALLAPLPAWAQPPSQPPVEAKKPVRVGPTTVTVIDEGESVDDIISRVKRARQERAAGTRTAPAATPPVDPSAREKVKNKVRERASRKELRERAQRLRDNLRERRANRLRRAE